MCNTICIVYVRAKALFDYYRHIKFPKKHQDNFISIDDDNIISNYNDRKIEFCFVLL
ncbi:hypothetical protein SD457_05805 [Coprobacillaceae bacterium CR2/5/TPMF4]|nr:hypothetical protein SD457_05805 [Coprobacillaceae bacterium CR2/5/TPMF4]